MHATRVACCAPNIQRQPASSAAGSAALCNADGVQSCLRRSCRGWGCGSLRHRQMSACCIAQDGLAGESSDAAEGTHQPSPETATQATLVGKEFRAIGCCQSDHQAGCAGQLKLAQHHERRIIRPKNFGERPRCVCSSRGVDDVQYWCCSLSASQRQVALRRWMLELELH